MEETEVVWKQKPISMPLCPTEILRGLESKPGFRSEGSDSVLGIFFPVFNNIILKINDEVQTYTSVFFYSATSVSILTDWICQFMSVLLPLTEP
jgi:hypothetical protein